MPELRLSIKNRAGKSFFTRLSISDDPVRQYQDGLTLIGEWNGEQKHHLHLV